MQVVDTTQTVLTALILAFVFRAFFIEPFIIPTGSMAPALLGAHGTELCPRCGCQFDYGSDRAPTDDDTTFYLPARAVCPNCFERIELDPNREQPTAGDRILVHKWPFALGGIFGPRPWDVIVFRDPVRPERNYIKRLIGLPGQTIEIIDGDVYIDGRIARKTAAAQSVLWSPVWRQDYLPAAPPAEADAESADQQGDDSLGWSGLDQRVLRYDEADTAERSIVFDPHVHTQYGLDMYAFNGESSGAVVRDLRVRGEVLFRAGDGWCRWTLARGVQVHEAERADVAGARERPGVFRPGHSRPLESGYEFSATLHRDGTVELEAVQHDLGTAPLRRYGERVQLGAFGSDPVVLELGFVDARLYLRVNDRPVLEAGADAIAASQDTLRVQRERCPVTHATCPATVALSASAVTLELRGLRIDRDVYYTRNPDTLRAAGNRPVSLGAGEYFVLGDNSPRSHDGRAWFRLGPQFDPASYHIGTVREDQIVGKAFFVYLPGLMSLDDAGRWRVPDLGRIRFIR